MKSSGSYHLGYIAGSVAAAFLALLGICYDSPALYTTVPGIIGGIMAGIATMRFLKDKTDLAGFIATTCGFVFYQAFQTNPVTQGEFVVSLQAIPIQDKAIGLVLANLTTAMLLLPCRIISNAMHRTIRRWVPDPGWVSRDKVDRYVMVGFWILFTVVAVPNVLFGKVVVGSIDSILYQRTVAADNESLGGFTAWGGAVGQSAVNLTIWATSLCVIWMYLLRSRYRMVMLVLAPLVLLWTAGVGMHGSRTYLAILGAAVTVYFLGNPKSGKKVFVYAIVVAPVLLLLQQISTSFRGTGLKAFNWQELAASKFEIRGNEGASSEIDGMQYARTELLEKGLLPNPLIGLWGGLVGRPVESLLLPVPRSLFPWKSVDQTATAYNLWFENVRLGVTTDEVFLGASPGLVGRELAKYGIFGPLTLLFWFGFALALADRLYSTGAASDFHRAFAALLIAFVVAEARDFVPLWLMPFIPAMLLFGFIARRARINYRLAGLRNGAKRGAKPHQLSATWP
jgi:hypothetical protein